MNKIKIHRLVGINGTTLILFVAQAHCWQFRLISTNGAVFGERRIYYTPEAALMAELEWVGQAD